MSAVEKNTQLKLIAYCVSARMWLDMNKQQSQFSLGTMQKKKKNSTHGPLRPL